MLVVQYLQDCAAIVERFDHEIGAPYVSAWRGTNGLWHNMHSPGKLTYPWIPHPDEDQVFADYCAWRLTRG